MTRTEWRPARAAPSFLSRRVLRRTRGGERTRGSPLRSVCSPSVRRGVPVAQGLGRARLIFHRRAPSSTAEVYRRGVAGSGAGDDRPELLEHLGEDRAGLTPWVFPVSLFPCSIRSSLARWQASASSRWRARPAWSWWFVPWAGRAGGECGRGTRVRSEADPGPFGVVVEAVYSIGCLLYGVGRVSGCGRRGRAGGERRGCARGGGDPAERLRAAAAGAAAWGRSGGRSRRRAGGTAGGWSRPSRRPPSRPGTCSVPASGRRCGCSSSIRGKRWWPRSRGGSAARWPT